MQNTHSHVMPPRHRPTICHQFSFDFPLLAPNFSVFDSKNHLKIVTLFLFQSEKCVFKIVSSELTLCVGRYADIINAKLGIDVMLRSVPHFFYCSKNKSTHKHQSNDCATNVSTARILAARRKTKNTSQKINYNTIHRIQMIFT